MIKKMIASLLTFLCVMSMGLLPVSAQGLSLGGSLSDTGAFEDKNLRYEADAWTGYFKINTALVFNSPSATADNIVSVGYINTGLTVLGTSGDFYYINYNSTDAGRGDGSTDDPAIGSHYGYVKQSDVSVSGNNPSTARAVSDAEFDLEVLRLVNIERAKVGLAPYGNGSVKLWAAARARANEVSGSFSVSLRPDSRNSDTIFTDVNLACRNRYQTALRAKITDTPSYIVDSLMHRAYHRPGLLGFSQNSFVSRNVVASSYRYLYLFAVEETADNPTVNRFYGADRYSTAAAISNSGWTSAENAIIASGLEAYDALAGGPLAKVLDAPIFLTKGGSALETPVKDQLQKLGVKKVYILGGNQAISDAIFNELAARYGTNNVERIYGTSRYETAVEIAKKIDSIKGASPSQVFIANGLSYPDALSISPVAAIMGAPILFTPATSTGVNAAAKNYIADKEIAKATLVGGPVAVTDDVAVKLGEIGVSCDRVYGNTRYLTSVAIVQTYKSYFGGKQGIVLATGENFADALSGSSFAAKKVIPILLIDPRGLEIPGTKDAVLEATSKDFYVFGGTAALPDFAIENNSFRY